MEFLGRNVATAATAATYTRLAQLVALQVPLNQRLLTTLALIPGRPSTLRSLRAANPHMRAQVYPKWKRLIAGVANHGHASTTRVLLNAAANGWNHWLR